MTVGNTTGENFLGIGGNLPTQIEGRAAVAIRDFERLAHPVPKLAVVLTPKVVVGQRPTGFELAIDTGGIEKPLFGGLEIAADFGGDTEANARRGRNR